MHISDGIIDTNICMVANVAAVSLVYLTGRKTTLDEIPRMGMAGAALFVVSLIHFPVAGTSIHLGLFGIVGIILGKKAFPAVFTAIMFQSLIFQHGGLVTLGVNSLIMGAGAFSGWLVWKKLPAPEILKAFLAGFAGIIIPVFLMSLAFHFSGYGRGVFFLFSIYLIAAIIEGFISFSAAGFIRKVKPGLLS